MLCRFSLSLIWISRKCEINKFEQNLIGRLNYLLLNYLITQKKMLFSASLSDVDKHLKGLLINSAERYILSYDVLRTSTADRRK